MQDREEQLDLVDQLVCGGIHVKVHRDTDRVCVVVVIGVRSEGTKELVALAEEHRESAETWADLLRKCRRRGIAAPGLAVGAGTLGFGKLEGVA